LAGKKCFIDRLLSSEDKPEKKAAEKIKPVTNLAKSNANTQPASRSSATAKKVTREDLAEALAYGEMRLTQAYPQASRR